MIWKPVGFFDKPIFFPNIVHFKKELYVIFSFAEVKRGLMFGRKLFV